MPLCLQQSHWGIIRSTQARQDAVALALLNIAPSVSCGAGPLRTPALSVLLCLAPRCEQLEYGTRITEHTSAVPPLPARTYLHPPRPPRHSCRSPSRRRRRRRRPEPAYPHARFAPETSNPGWSPPETLRAEQLRPPMKNCPPHGRARSPNVLP